MRAFAAHLTVVCACLSGGVLADGPAETPPAGGPHPWATLPAALRDALHHRALQELPGHVEPEAYAAERQTVLNSWQRWLITPASILA